VSVDDCAKTYPNSDFQDRVLDDVSGDVERIVQLRAQLKEVENEIESLQTKVMSAMQEAETARAGRFLVKWPVRRYKGQPEKIVPATEERVIRLKTLQIKEI
jgi:cell division septum initiation protein DivIVA